MSTALFGCQSYCRIAALVKEVLRRRHHVLTYAGYRHDRAEQKGRAEGQTLLVKVAKEEINIEETKHMVIKI